MVSYSFSPGKFFILFYDISVVWYFSRILCILLFFANFNFFLNIALLHIRPNARI